MLSSLRVFNIKGLLKQSLMLLLFCLFAPLSLAQSSAEGSEKDDSLIVMQAYNEQALADAESNLISEEEKHQILFVMGVMLLVLLIATAYFGIAMGVGGKDVFVQHMVCAALSLTLAGVHAVTAIVWFFPF